MLNVKYNVLNIILFAYNIMSKPFGVIMITTHGIVRIEDKLPLWKNETDLTLITSVEHCSNTVNVSNDPLNKQLHNRINEIVMGAGPDAVQIENLRENLIFPNLEGTDGVQTRGLARNPECLRIAREGASSDEEYAQFCHIERFKAMKFNSGSTLVNKQYEAYKREEYGDLYDNRIMLWLFDGENGHAIDILPTWSALAAQADIIKEREAIAKLKTNLLQVICSS